MDDIKISEAWKYYKKELILLASLFVAAMGIKLYFLQFYRVISSDGIGYVTIAQTFIRGDGLAGATHFPPFYPILVGIMNLLVPDVELAGRLVSMIMGSLIVIPIYLLACEFFNKRVGILAILLSIAWPSLRGWSGEVMSQSTYITLALTGTYFSWRAYKRDSIVLFFITGIILGLSYLTRPEGFVLFASLTLCIVLLSIYEKKPLKTVFIMIAIAWIAFIIVALPYISLLHDHTGKWQLTGKTSATLADSLSDYLGGSALKKDPRFKDIGFIDVINKYPGYLRHTTVSNIVKIWNEMLPVFMWLMALVGFVTGEWNKKNISERIYLISTYAPFLVNIVFFFLGPEYMQLYLPVLFLWASQGICWAENYTFKICAFDGRFGIKKLYSTISISVVLVLFYSMYLTIKQVPDKSYNSYNFTQDGARYDQKRIGLLVDKYLPKDAKIMTMSARIAYYSKRPYVDIPQVSLEEILSFARKSHVRYIVIDGKLADMMGGVLSEPLMSGEKKVFYEAKDNWFSLLPGLGLYLLYKDPSSIGVAIYELKDK